MILIVSNRINPCPGFADTNQVNYCFGVGKGSIYDFCQVMLSEIAFIT
jgi:hypothetical protein